MTDRVRTRTYQWTSPDYERPAHAEMSSLEMFQAMIRGEHPPNPIQATIGWTIEQVEPGFARLRLAPQDYLFHGGGVLHGGVISTLLDSVMAVAVLAALPRGRHCTTLQLSVNTMRGIKPDAPALIAEGRADHIASKAAAASATLSDEADKVYAKAMSSFVVFDIAKDA